MVQRVMFSWFLGLSLLCSVAQAQVICSSASRELLQAHLQALRAQSELSDCAMGPIAVAVGQRLLGLPYVAQTLEKPGPEQLVVELEGLDCTTFLENVVVLSRLVKRQDLSMAAYEKELRYLRYRQGQLEGYPSRLHYFSDWLYDNEQKGILTNITAQIGGEPYRKTIAFMGEHRSAYASLENDDHYAAILTAEANLNQRERYYLPQEKVAGHEHQIRDGDLIAITTSVDGLDVSHVGLALHHRGRLHLLHASTGAKQVVISERPLAAYLQAHRSQTGIMVARLQSPR